MSTKGPVEEATEAQTYATAPQACAYAAASAGSGKTTVLTSRVLRLLLNRERPDALLCLTFTRTGAAQMLEKLRAALADWALADDEALSERLEKLLGAAPDAEMLAAARGLYPRALEAPGGLKIQTVHAFCQALLTRFPVEAGVAPGFTALDERGAAEAIGLARRAALADPDLQPAIAVLAGANDMAIGAALDSFLAERGRLTDLVARPDRAERVADALGLEWPVPDAGELRASACADGAFDAEGLALAAEALIGLSNEKKQARGATLRSWLGAEPEDRVAGWTRYRSVFITNEGAPRKNPDMLPKDGHGTAPRGLDDMAIEAARLLSVDQRRNAAMIHARTMAALDFSAAVLARYTRWKDAHGRLDYEDLILKARAFLASEGGAGWAHYKLDQGIRHILVDEAQDTNPDQWAVIRALAEPFFDDEAERGRTLFLVGDRKQSIFGFQRAAPEMFGRFAEDMQRRSEAAGVEWRNARINISFRSTQTVLDLVDQVFAGDARRGLGEEREIRHRAARENAPGRIELWPLMEAVKADPPPPWTPPAPGGDAGQSGEGRMAEACARVIRRWVDDEEVLSSTGAPVRYGDIMVLMRKRGRFPDLFAEACARHGVPMAGADRLDLDRTLAALDLRALCRFLLTPQDDLSLAIALKSPLFGLSEDELFELAHGRPHGLWDALRTAGGPAAETLKRLLADADFARPYELLAGLLAQGGRARMRGAFGAEANDAIDELLSLALAFEADHPPSLQGFMAWLDAGGAEVKREQPPRGVDEVRMMTVHAAKGLEAPVVILADGGEPQDGRDALWPATHDGVALWRPTKAEDCAATAAAKAAEKAAHEEENRRLLYVAITRAEDRFCFGGWGKPDKGWRRLITEGFRRLDARSLDFAETYGLDDPPSGDSEMLRVESGAEIVADDKTAAPAPVDEPAPDWLYRPPAEEARPKPPLAPSRLQGAPGPDLSPTGDGAAARRRGVLIHGLLETLPDLAADQRHAACARWLAARAPDLGAAAHGEMTAAALGALEAEDAAPFFGPGGRAEAALVGVVETPQGKLRVSGRVDRLRIADGTAWLLDYKTDRSPAQGDAPDAYLDQLALYAGLLRQLPGIARIECALLWTAGPRVQRVGDPAARLDSLFERADL